MALIVKLYIYSRIPPTVISEIYVEHALSNPDCLAISFDMPEDFPN